jgi:formylglycine-generating enzyme
VPEQPPIAEEVPPKADPYLTAEKPPRCPPEMVLLPEDVCIDRWEASLVQVLPDGSEQRWSPFQTLGKRSVAVRAVSQAGVVPQAHISGVQAEAACRASGKRLCTASEWETACMGPQRTTYPYGNGRQKHVCNDDGRSRHPVVALTQQLGLSEAEMWRNNMDHPMLNQLPDTLTKTGERTGCTNEYGAYDMVGNLHEWIEDADGTFRGGFYMDTRINGEGCTYATTAHGLKYHDYSTGFRCCMDALGAE